MDSTNVSQIEQTPFTFRGDEQALRTVVDRAVDDLPGSRITSRTLPGHLAPGRLSEAAWIERYTETVRGVEVRRLRAIWIGAGRLDGPSFSYRCAYIDRADDDAAARIELWQRGIRQRDDESESMRLHVKLSKVQDATITGTIEAPALLRFAVDAIVQAIKEAGREVQTAAPTGDAPSDDAGNTATGAQSDDQAGALRPGRRYVEDNVKRAHELLKDGKTTPTAVFRLARTDKRTYKRYCEGVTGEKPLV